MLPKTKHFSGILFSCLMILFSGCQKTKLTDKTKAAPSGYKIYSNQSGNILRSFTTAPDGGYVFGGYTDTTNHKNAFIQKCDHNGNVLWYHQFGGARADLFNVVRPTSDGGFIAAGSTNSYTNVLKNGFYFADAWLVKTDAQGNMLWQKTYGGDGPGLFYDVQQTSDNGYVATGAAGDKNWSGVGILKTNAYGSIIWDKHFYNIEGNAGGTSIALNDNGNIAVSGYYELHDPLGVLYPSLTILSAAGDTLIREKLFKQTGSLPWAMGSDLFRYGNLSFQKIIAATDGYIMLMSEDDVNLDVWLNGAKDISKKIIVFKTDLSGNVIWSRDYAGKGFGITFNDAKRLPSGEILVSGGAIDFDGKNDNWLLTLNASGRKESEIFIPMTTSGSWLAGAELIGSTYVMGFNQQLFQKNKKGFFGFMKTDKNGKIVDN